MNETNEKTIPVRDHVRTNLSRGGAIGKLTTADWDHGRGFALAVLSLMAVLALLPRTVAGFRRGASFR